jgi:predicted ribonuclease toxin of YeeF-YezG toxin-antitoxin module
MNTLGLSVRRAANGEMEMNAQATKLRAVDNDLKQLMADVTRAMEKAQEAVAKIAKTATATTESESTISSCQSEPS